MSLPEFPCPENILTRDEAINAILTSIAMEETALSHIINAEGEKIQYAIQGIDCNRCCVAMQMILDVNKSVTCLIEQINEMQFIMKNKMRLAISFLPPEICGEPNQPCLSTPEDPCHNPCSCQCRTSQNPCQCHNPCQSACQCRNQNTYQPPGQNPGQSPCQCQSAAKNPCTSWGPGFCQNPCAGTCQSAGNSPCSCRNTNQVPCQNQYASSCQSQCRNQCRYGWPNMFQPQKGFAEW